MVRSPRSCHTPRAVSCEAPERSTAGHRYRASSASKRKVTMIAGTASRYASVADNSVRRARCVAPHCSVDLIWHKKRAGAYSGPSRSKTCFAVAIPWRCHIPLRPSTLRGVATFDRAVDMPVTDSSPMRPTQRRSQVIGWSAKRLAVVTCN